jgi:Flavin reductase like domain
MLVAITVLSPPATCRLSPCRRTSRFTQCWRTRLTSGPGRTTNQSTRLTRRAVASLYYCYVGDRRGTIPLHEPWVTDTAYRRVLSHFCTGVVVVAAISESRPTGLTCQAFSALSLSPPLVTVGIGAASTSWPKIEREATFCVSVLSSGQRWLAQQFAIRGEEKFANVTWHPSPRGSPIYLGVCRVDRVLPTVCDSRGRPLRRHRGGHRAWGYDREGTTAILSRRIYGTRSGPRPSSGFAVAYGLFMCTRSVIRVSGATSTRSAAESRP